MIYQDILYIVVQEDGYRIVKKEHKTSRIKANEDFDLHDMEQIRAYHYLEELLPELVNAYETLTGHRVTPTSTEPRWYVSCYSSKTHNRGLHRCLLFLFFCAQHATGIPNSLLNSAAVAVDSISILIKRI